MSAAVLRKPGTKLSPATLTEIAGEALASFSSSKQCRRPRSAGVSNLSRRQNAKTLMHRVAIRMGRTELCGRQDYGSSARVAGPDHAPSTFSCPRSRSVAAFTISQRTAGHSALISCRCV